jgi:tripartite-type tricarboxylate transporter receptor subunit TctC
VAAQTDTQLTHIPFPAGGGFGYTDILAGRIDMMINIPD